MIRLASHTRLATIGCIVASSLAAQSPPVTSPAADDPDVQGAERLFSMWMEGQIAYRGLSGIVVGVVSDQTLVWTKGFGYANVAGKQAMTPATRFPHGVTQQAVHVHRDHAAARAGEDPAR